MKAVRRQLRRTLLPFSAAAIGVYLLIGCIYVPGKDDVPSNERDPRPDVGQSHSDRPLRVGVSSREDVHRLLGMPSRVSDDRRAWFYQWGARNGRWVYPLCFSSDPAFRLYTMRLEFADDGLLRRFKVSHGPLGPMATDAYAPPRVRDTAATRPAPPAPAAAN